MGTDQCGMKATGILRFYGFEHASLLPLENEQVFVVTGKQLSPGNASTMAFTPALSNNNVDHCLSLDASCAPDKFTHGLVHKRLLLFHGTSSYTQAAIQEEEQQQEQQ